MLHLLHLLGAYLWHVTQWVGLGLLGILLLQAGPALLARLLRQRAPVLELIGSCLAMAWYVGCLFAGVLEPWLALPPVQVLCVVLAVVGSGLFHWQTREFLPGYSPAVRPATATSPSDRAAA